MTDISRLAEALAERYELDREVGEGGMAIVYLARDLRHDRPVALKVLRPELGAVLGAERFLAEIRVTANLQHPNLLPLFDSGAAEGFLYYVMPFVEDETLRARLDREQQLPVDEAVHIAGAVAGALDYAHRQGVIHRDLKPENILMHEGEPLVADFGIALAVSNAGGGRITQTGLSLGTPQYMSPEQATGDGVVDGRTDVYSLGALTYEMLTGEPPHTAHTAQAILARLLTEEPRPIRATRSSVPAHVEASVARALAKLPADRFATAREFADGLTGKIVVDPVHAARGGTATAGRSARERRLAGVAGLLALLWVVTAVFALTRSAPDSMAPVVRFTVERPPSMSTYNISASPDGSGVLYSAGTSMAPYLLLRRLDEPSATPIEGTEGAHSGYWSPDSRQIVFSVNDRVLRMDAAGGLPETVTASPDGQNVLGIIGWSRDGTIAFTSGDALYMAPASGGPPERIEVVGPANFRFLQFLPDGRHMLLQGRDEVQPVDEREVYVAAVDGRDPVRVTSSRFNVQVVAPDQLLFQRDNTLYTQTLDMKTFQLIGEPVRVAGGVAANTINGNNGFSSSDTGVLVVKPVGDSRQRRLSWFGRSGERLGSVGEPLYMRDFSLAPDESRVAVAGSTDDTFSDILILDLETGIRSLLAGRPTASSITPVWSADATSLIYKVGDSILARGVGSARDSFIAQIGGLLASYEANGDEVLIADDTLIAVPMEGERAMRRMLTTGGRPARGAHVSPDGRSIAYPDTGDEDYEIWVASYPSMENRRQVSADGGLHPRWRRDGRELFFIDADGWVVAAEATDDPVPTFSSPVRLFQGPPRPEVWGNRFDVSADGERFLLAETVDDDDGEESLLVTLNWTNVLGGSR
jgi:serine/threonine-protein kinase